MSESRTMRVFGEWFVCEDGAGIYLKHRDGCEVPVTGNTSHPSDMVLRVEEKSWATGATVVSLVRALEWLGVIETGDASKQQTGAS